MTNRTCTIDGCDKPHVCRGLCHTHNSRRRRGLPLDAPVRPRAVALGRCEFDNCSEKAFAKRLCKRHYQSQYVRESKRSRREAWIAEQGGRCVHCGSDDRLEVDHIEPALKEIEIGALWAYSDEVRERELAKCQVLCKTCHIEKTRADRQCGKTHAVPAA